MDFRHTSVLLKETIDGLNVRPDGIYADGTLGGGGHAYEICRRLGSAGRFIGMDRDGDAILAAEKKLSCFGEKVTVIRSNFSRMKDELNKLGIRKVDGIVLDLGVSSYQLDAAERGFTYRISVPLDMRMDVREEKTARDIVNYYSEERLYGIIRDYGEERFAKSIARHIAQERKTHSIETTGQLTDIIRRAIPAKYQKSAGHPAKRTFQAIRIELNRELEELESGLDDMIELLNPGGRICVITFHSLEDRIVKEKFKKSENPCTCPPDFPICVCGNISKGKVITRKPVLPDKAEIEENSRAKSAKLRIFERR